MQYIKKIAMDRTLKFPLREQVTRVRKFCVNRILYMEHPSALIYHIS